MPLVALILCHEVFNAFSGKFIAVVMTSQTQLAGLPLTLEITSSVLPKQSWVKSSQIRTLSVDRLGSKLAEARPEEPARIIQGLNEIIG